LPQGVLITAIVKEYLKFGSEAPTPYVNFYPIRNSGSVPIGFPYGPMVAYVGCASAFEMLRTRYNCETLVLLPCP